ncbi:DUF2809 domain-containing protein [Clostridium gasigenes]|nr:DUF2809 domain-containing protein [Clostridium gasigenes]MBU3087865.1 DUF2809 domain-containing protein [Clostridium gasigenes]
MKRKRILYLGLITIVMILGICSRKYGGYLPGIISEYSGDILWALMVYLGFGFLFSKSPIRYIALISLIFSWGIEISQLYQGKLINVIRQTTLGALVLGRGFLFSDLVCYTIGILIGVSFEYFYFYSISKKSNGVVK